MTLPRSAEFHDDKLAGGDTIVSYPRGDTSNSAIVLHVEQLTSDGLPQQRWAVLLDATSCHPVDAAWPDQGADRGRLLLAASAHVDQSEAAHTRQIIDCVVAASDGTALYLGSEIPVRKGTEGWAFVVAHIVDDASGIVEGERVELTVDEGYRRALSLGHTSCHLAALALNRALAARWSKETRLDGLGQPDFDSAAMESSRIVENGAVDVYRLNKSLRRKGFAVDSLGEELSRIESAVNATLGEWMATGAAVRVEAQGPRLTDRRSWVCELPEGTANIPCGGTHATSLAELGDARVILSLDEADGTTSLTMTTTVSGS